MLLQQTRHICMVLHLVSISFLSAQKLDVPNLLPNGSRPFTIHLQRSICTGHPNEYTRIFECRVKLARGRPATTTLRGAFDKPIETLLVNFALLYKYTSSYRPLLMATECDVCEYLGKGLRVRDQVADVLYEAVFQFAPWLKPCLWSVGNYSVIDFQPIESKMPNFLPAGEYRAETRLYDARNVTILHHQAFLLVRAKGVFDLSMG